jgi:hypothetical protein
VRIVLYDYGRGRCPWGSFQRGDRIRLGPRAQLEGYGLGYNVLLCLRGHSLQAFVKVGGGVPPAMLAQARAVLASVRLTRRPTRSRTSIRCVCSGARNSGGRSGSGGSATRARRGGCSSSAASTVTSAPGWPSLRACSR